MRPGVRPHGQCADLGLVAQPADPFSMSRRGRPPLNRGELLQMIRPASGRERLVAVNERVLARQLGWHRSTVIRAIGDLERAGSVRRYRNAGRGGVVLLVGVPAEPPRRA